MYKPPKIIDEGLKSFLDRTADKHDGLKFTDFERMIKRDISVSSMAALFGVDRRTIQKWAAIYKDENGSGK